MIQLASPPLSYPIDGGAIWRDAVEDAVEMPESAAEDAGKEEEDMRMRGEESSAASAPVDNVQSDSQCASRANS
jgi:hypothetical protein